MMLDIFTGKRQTCPSVTMCMYCILYQRYPWNWGAYFVFADFYHATELPIFLFPLTYSL